MMMMNRLTGVATLALVATLVAVQTCTDEGITITGGSSGLFSSGGASQRRLQECVQPSPCARCVARCVLT